MTRFEVGAINREPSTPAVAGVAATAPLRREPQSGTRFSEALDRRLQPGDTSAPSGASKPLNTPRADASSTRIEAQGTPAPSAEAASDAQIPPSSTGRADQETELEDAEHADLGAPAPVAPAPLDVSPTGAAGTNVALSADAPSAPAEEAAASPEGGQSLPLQTAEPARGHASSGPAPIVPSVTNAGPEAAPGSTAQPPFNEATPAVDGNVPSAKQAPAEASSAKLSPTPLVGEQAPDEAAGRSEHNAQSDSQRTPSDRAVLVVEAETDAPPQRVVPNRPTVAPPTGASAVRVESRALKDQQTPAPRSAEPAAVAPVVDAGADAGNSAGEDSGTSTERRANLSAARIDTDVKPPTTGTPGAEVAGIGAPTTRPAPLPGVPNLGAPQAQPSPAQSDPAAQTVARGLAAVVNQRGGTMTLRLTPESLGTVRIHMQVEQGAVSVRLETSSAAAQGLLAENLAMLRGALESRGLTVERLTVQAAPAGTLGAAPAAQAGHQSGASNGQQFGQGGPDSQWQDAAGEESRGRQHGDREETGRQAFEDAAEPWQDGLGHAPFGGRLRVRLEATA